MRAEIPNVAISGAKGFVGKNLRKFLSLNKICPISISRNNFKTSKFPSLKTATHFIHLVGIGSESVSYTHLRAHETEAALV